MKIGIIQILPKLNEKDHFFLEFSNSTLKDVS